ncbi:sensor histidine kinase [Victivallis lenta]|uniref:sensor histidine kinase n=1 Tax=Victivallis lenta TaxID=2606640 RepID=UPI003AB62D25
MKIVRKISTCIFLLGFLCGVCAIPIVILGLPELTNIYRSRVDTNLGDWVAILGLGGVLLGFFITVLILIRVIRQVVLPVRIAAEFADKLANGEFPDRLSEERKANDEIQTLYTALNLLRDRQQNLNSKLKLSLSREADMRRGAESYSLLQLKIIARMLPEMRIPLGSIKGFSRILMLELESGKPDRAEIGRLLEETGHRVGALSRQIDRLVDIAELDRDRWERAEVVEFDTAEFMRELVAFNQISLQEREVMLVNHFSASAPERLVLDRELLHQLLIIMILAVGRAAAAGETLVVSCLHEENKIIFEVRDSKHAPLREPLAEQYRRFEESDGADGVAADALSVPILGLVFARDLAAKLGGVLRVSSSAQAGAVLRFELSDSCAATGGESRRVHSSGRAPVKRGAHAKEEPEEPGQGRVLRVLHGTEVADAPLLLRRLLGAGNIEVCSFSTAEKLVEQAGQESFDGLILSPTLKNCELPELIGELRRVSGRRDLAAVVISSSFPDELRNELQMLDRVFLLNVPVNFALLSRILRESAGAGKRTQAS